MKVSNNKVRGLVNSKEIFKNSKGSIFSENRHGVDGKEIYVVYSYGYHFPMYIYKNGMWFGNKDKYSQTTSCHQSKAMPSGEIEYLSTSELKDMID